MIRTFAVAVASILIAGSAFAAAPKLSSQDKTFFNEAAQGGLLEVQLGTLASEKATNPDVKQFAQRMVTDHGQANQQLSAVAGQLGLTMPEKLDKKHQQMYDRLAKESGAKFDQAYMNEMVKDHQNDINAFQKQERSGKNPDLQGFAKQTLPVLQEHLQLAKGVQERLKSGGAATGGADAGCPAPIDGGTGDAGEDAGVGAGAGVGGAGAGAGVGTGGISAGATTGGADAGSGRGGSGNVDAGY